MFPIQNREGSAWRASIAIPIPHATWRTQFPTIPPTTEYALTDLGGAMYPVIAAMAEFGRALQAAGPRD